MNKNYHLIINFVGFQVAWFTCVLMAAKNQPMNGIAVALVVAAVHLYLVDNRLRALTLLVIITLIGSTWDSLLTSQKILVFSSGILSPNLAPTWIIAMWLSFATTLSVSLRWLYKRYVLAFVLGTISGPLAYQAGAALGAVSIPDNMTANIFLAFGWGLLMPLLVFIAETFENMSTNRVATHEH